MSGHKNDTLLARFVVNDHLVVRPSAISIAMAKFPAKCAANTCLIDSLSAAIIPNILEISNKMFSTKLQRFINILMSGKFFPH
jgi:hypothetical protein